MKAITPFRLVVLFAALSAFSLLVCLPRLSVQYLPQASGTLMAISYSLPGSTPQVAEQQVTSLLENSLSMLSGIDQQYSKSSYNGGSVSLRFKKGTDMQVKQFEVAAILRRLYAKLPSGTSYPTISIQAPGNDKRSQPLLIYSLHAPLAGQGLANITEKELLPTLRQINGIQNIQVSGVPNQQLVISFDPQRCRAWGVDPNDLLSLLNKQQTGWLGGSISGTNSERWFVQNSQNNADPNALNDLLVPTANGTMLPLSKIARVFFEEEAPQQWFRINGENALTVSIFAKEGANNLTLSENIKQAVRQKSLDLPATVSVELDYDDAAFLQKEITKNNRRAGLSMGILLLFMLVAYRHWKHLLVLSLSLVVTLSLTTMLVWALGISIHLYSIAGIAIAFGLLIDNAIVMLDYYRQHGNRSVFLALLAATLTTMAALLLIFLLPESDRQNLGDFAAVISVALAASLVVSLGFTPALYTLLWGSEIPVRSTSLPTAKFRGIKSLYGTLIAFLARYRKTYACLLVLAFGLPIYMLPDTMEGESMLAKSYNQTLGNSWFQKEIRPVAEKYLGGALYQFRFNVFEKSGYRSPEQTRLYVQTQLPFGHTPDQMNALMEALDRFLAGTEGLSKYMTQVYSGQQAGVEIHFTEAAEKSGIPFTLKSKLIARAVDWGGADWDVYGVGRGFSNAGGAEIPNFRLKFTGYNYDQTERYANKLGERLLQHPRIQAVNTNEKMDWYEKAAQELVLKVSEKDLATAGASLPQVFEAIREISPPANPQSNLNIQNQNYPVLLKATDAENFSRYAVLEEPLTLDSNRHITLKNAAVMELENTANTLVRENRSYVRMVGFDYLGSSHFGSQFLDKVLKELKPQLAAGYTIERESYSWDWNTAKRQYGLLFLLALAIFCICAVLFGKFKQSFYIVTMIPLSFIGLFLTFSWGDFYFDQGGYAAFVLLAGLVVNAAIFIVNDYNLPGQKTGVSASNSFLLESTLQRARTILLTVLSTGCSLIPFIWEGQQEIFWFSFATGSIGGLFASLWAVFFVLPVLMWKKEN